MERSKVKPPRTRREFEDVLRKELDSADVGVRKWKRNGGGQADFDLEFVDVPRPKNPYLLGVGFHEIGHIHYHRTYEGYDELPTYHLEYLAEIFALEKLKQYGLPTREYRAYATKYVLVCMARYKNDGGSVRDIPKEIRRWAHIEYRKWLVAEKVYVENTKVSSIKDIKILYKWPDWLNPKEDTRV